MTKLKLTTLLFMLSFLIVSSHAANISIIQTENVPVVMTAETQHSGDDKSGSMNVSINGHYLTVAFTESLGEVSIEVQNTSGIPLDVSIMDTPSGRQIYIPSAGSYILIIKLENGDEYHGNFEVSE